MRLAGKNPVYLRSFGSIYDVEPLSVVRTYTRSRPQWNSIRVPHAPQTL